MLWDIHTIQKSDLLKTREFHFSFVWDIDFGIIFPYLDRAKAYTVNSNLTKLVDVQRLDDNIKWEKAKENIF